MMRCDIVENIHEVIGYRHPRDENNEKESTTSCRINKQGIILIFIPIFLFFIFPANIVFFSFLCTIISGCLPEWQITCTG